MSNLVKPSLMFSCFDACLFTSTEALKSSPMTLCGKLSSFRTVASVRYFLGTSAVGLNSDKIRYYLA